MNRFLTAALAGLIATTPGSAREMIGNWRVDHFKPFGLWESMCDHREQENRQIRRCYIRYVDGYSPGEPFGAAFLFVTAPGPGDLRYEFGFEPGTRFAEDGFVVMRDDAIIWILDTATCAGGNSCIIEGDAALDLSNLLGGGGRLVFRFADRHGRDWRREWTAPDYDEVLADFQAASAERELPF